MQALGQHVGADGASLASAKRRRVSLAGLVAGCVTVLAASVAPDGLPQRLGLASFQVYVRPRRTTTLASYVLAPQVQFMIDFCALR